MAQRVRLSNITQAGEPVVPIAVPPKHKSLTVAEESVRRLTGTLTVRREDTAYRLLTQLGGGTEQWAVHIRELATGGPADRTRAAQIVRFSWYHSVWTEVVPGLLDAGLDEHTTKQLLEGLLMENVDYNLDDATQSRLDVLQPLLKDSRAAVQEFADCATRELGSLPMFTRRVRSTETG